MEFEKLAPPRRSVSDSAGDHPRIGFRRTSPWLSKCHPNSRGRDRWTGFPSRTDSQRLTVGNDTEIFDMHCPSTFVRGAQGVLGRSHSYIFDTQLTCGMILLEEFLFYASKPSSCRPLGYFNRVLILQAHVGYDMASSSPSTAAAAVMQLSVAADANKGQTKGLVKAVGMAESDVT